MFADVLIVIDLQNDVCAELYNRENLLKQVNQRIAEYRQANLPILFIQHDEVGLEKYSEGWQLVPELDVLETDIICYKTHANGFYKTNLQEILTDLQAEKLEFCGAQTEYCVNTTLVYAHGLGYQNFMQTGATSTVDSNFMTAQETIKFYEQKIWNERFLEFI